MIFFNETSKDENENIEQKNCNFNFIFQIIKCIFRIMIFIIKTLLQKKIDEFYNQKKNQMKFKQTFSKKKQNDFD